MIDLVHRTHPFIFTPLALTLGDRTIVYRQPVHGDPPAGFHFYQIRLPVQVGTDKRSGQPLIVEVEATFNAASHVLAFEEAENAEKAAVDKARSEFRQQLLVANVSPNLNGHNLRITS